MKKDDENVKSIILKNCIFHISHPAIVGIEVIAGTLKSNTPITKDGSNLTEVKEIQLEGKTISLSDEKFKNKVVIVQLMGTWCPNCIDETKFLATFYDQYKSKGLEVVGLAFERTDDFAKAVVNLNRVKNRFNANYEFLVTMKTGGVQASEALPMLNKVMAFPTSIYIDKKGVVRKIYTGFYGPATGDNYIKYVEETTRFVEKLLSE